MGLNCEPKRSHGHIKSRMATDQVYRSGLGAIVIFAIYLQVLHEFISTLNRIGPSLASPLTIATLNGAISLNQ